MNNEIIKAIVSGDCQKLNEVVKKKQGKVYVIRNFLDGLMITSWYDPEKYPDIEIRLDENSEFGKFLIESEKDLEKNKGL